MLAKSKALQFWGVSGKKVTGSLYLLNPQNENELEFVIYMCHIISVELGKLFDVISEILFYEEKYLKG